MAHVPAWISAIGFLAGALTTFAFLPQLLHTWTKKSAREISLGMLSAFSLGVSLWLVYGICLRAWPIILTNAVTLALTVIILILKIRYK